MMAVNKQLFLEQFRHSYNLVLKLTHTLLACVFFVTTQTQTFMKVIF